MAGFHRTVTSRYRTLLGELSDIPGEPHEQFVNAMITGNVTLLEAGFDARNGPGSFVGRFRAPSYGAARPVT